MSKRHDYSINHWCGLLPDMKPRAFAELKDDIELYGLKDKIELLNLEVVDGRHRLRALQELGIELSDEHFVHLDPKTDARAHVSSKNLKRRHLSTGAKAELARKFSQGSTRGGDRRSKKQRDHSAFLPNDPDSGTLTTKEAAEMWDISVRSVGQAGPVFDEDSKTPEPVKAAVRTGELSLSDVAKVARHSPEIQERALEVFRNGQAKTFTAAVETTQREPAADEPTNSGEAESPGQVYATIVVDPPWPVGKSVPATGLPVSSGYQSMTVEEIKGIRLPLEEDASLFLWCPKTHLPTAFGILEQWGLEYRNILIWRKEGGVRPPDTGGSDVEFVVVGTRGGPAFNESAVPSAIFPGHCPDPAAPWSAKPPEFDQIVSMVAPGPRLTLPADPTRLLQG